MKVNNVSMKSNHFILHQMTASFSSFILTCLFSSCFSLLRDFLIYYESFMNGSFFVCKGISPWYGWIRRFYLIKMN